VVANLLAAGTMAWYFWNRHPQLRQALGHVWDEE